MCVAGQQGTRRASHEPRLSTVRKQGHNLQITTLLNVESLFSSVLHVLSECVDYYNN